MKVRVYRNLHKRCLSVQARVDGRWKVIQHVDSITLLDPCFQVSTAGRERVLREKRKNVHAFVVGIYHEWAQDLLAINQQLGVCSRKVSYNPYKGKTFYTVDDSLPILWAGRCTVGPDGIHVW